MPPVGYPTRGAWVHRNVTRDFLFWPRLSSINISQSHPDALATYDCEVIEDDEHRYNEGVVFANEDIIEVTFAGDRIYAGILSVPAMDQPSQVGPRMWSLNAQDFTSKLDDAIVRRRSKRQREKVIRRVRWLLSWLRPSIWSLDGRDLNLPDRYAEPYEYFGMSVREALQQVADEHRLFFYINLDNVFRMFRTDVLDAPFDLDNEAPDYIDTFPFDSWRMEPDSVELANAVLVAPEDKDDARWSPNHESILAYHRHERFISDPNLAGPQQAINVGERALAQTDSPVETATCRVLEPGLWAGMRVNVREKLWDEDLVRIVKSVVITAVAPHDDEGKAELRQEVTLVDRRPARYRGDRGSRGDRPRPGQTANTQDRPLQHFNTDVPPPTIAEGSLISSVLADWFGLYNGVSRDEVTILGPSLGGLTAGSWIGEWYVGASSFRGYIENEQWSHFPVPTHPTDPAGIRLSFLLFNPQGYANDAAAWFEAVVMDSAPTDIRQGTLIGTFRADGVAHTIDIPIAQVPAAGVEFYIGIRPAWQADYGARVEGYLNWPYASSASQVDTNSIGWGGHSGRAQRSVTTSVTGVKWLTYSDAGGDLGSIESPAGAPYQGGNPIIEAGRSGSGVYQVDEGALQFTADEPSSISWYVPGEREDDDYPDGAWSDVRWAMGVIFSVDVAGDTGAPGNRGIEVQTIGQQQRTIGTVHLGDGDYAEGISVGGPTPLDYEASDMTEGARYKALFDSRSGVEVRGRLWTAGRKMPANIAVRTPMADTEDDMDRWVLTLRAGNDDGSPQTIRIHDTWYYPSAVSGKRVVRELIGRADGLTKRFWPAQKFRHGTLMFRIHGTDVAPEREDDDGFWADLDWWPTPGTIIRATYVAD